jgi:acyl-coenzyme A synthetase/AMP-(fatty) acid ligase
MNGAELLLAGHDSARTALECGGRRMSYGELRESVSRAAGAWRARGLRPAEPVAVKLPDGFDWVIAWLGALWAGGVAVGVNPRIPAPEWQAALEQADFALIVTDAAGDTPPRWRPRGLDDVAARAAWAEAQPIAPVSRRADDPALRVHSSGSSDRPKAVVHAQRALAAIARISTERLGIGADDRLYATSRLFFTYPLVNVLLAGLRIGATVLLDPQWPSTASVAAFVARQRPSVLFSVPAFYRSLLHEGLAAGLRDAGVRRCVSAGEALSPRLRDAWQQASGLPIFDGYGSAETLVLVLAAAPGEAALRASPGVSVQPLDAGAAACAQPTRLLIRCPTLAVGYHARAAAQAENFRDGAFCPADLFLRDGPGWRFAGREDSLVKISGRWVDLAALEEQLAAGVSGLREAAAACVADSDGVSALALFFAADDADAVRAVLAERVAALPPHQRPAWLHALPALPRTATGKLMRRALAAQMQRAEA